MPAPPRSHVHHVFAGDEDEARLVVVMLTVRGFEARLLEASASGRRHFTVASLEPDRARMELLVKRWAPSAVEI
jgi:hypothetical protein